MRLVRLAVAAALAAGIAMPFAASAAPPDLPDIYWTCRPYIGPNGEIGTVC
jgi:hypothetical protein